MSAKTFEELDNLIKNKGLKYDYVADQLGITRQRLYDIRVDPTTMSVDQMEELAFILSVKFMDVYQIYKNFKKKVPKSATEEKQEA